MARAALDDVDGGEDALVGQLAREVQLHVGGALELLEDDVVQAAAGLDQRGAEQRQAAAVLDVARRPEEALGLVEAVGVEAAGERLAARGAGQVIGAGQARQAVQQHERLLPLFREPFGPFHD